MFFREVRLSVCAGLVTALIAASGSLPVDAACTVETARPASSFLCTDNIEFTIKSDLPTQQLAWSVTDHEDEVRCQGEIRAGTGSTALRVRPSPGVGYFTLKLQYESGETNETAFCVLPHPDDARGDGGLFGLGGTPTDEMTWDAAWQIGARHFRTEFAWTVVEHEKDKYRMDWVRTVADLARERDMQMTVLTGHTPRHYGVKPIDYEDGPRWWKWQPERTVEWFTFVDEMARTLMPRHIDPEPAHPSDTLPRSGRRLVRAWEVWSEADQGFYAGSWERYLDMLRIAYCTIRRQGRVPVVYGSCGHWTQMAWTVLSGCEDYLDRVAFHPYFEEPRWMLMHWYRNMPQVLVARGRMVETALTECGFHAPEPEGEAGYMPRVYATLKAYGEDLHVRAECLGGVFHESNPSALAHITDDNQLRPLPAYVAFAVTRWMLESAHYVGPIEAPEGAEMLLFVRQGVPMVIGWTEEGVARVSLDTIPGAVVMDALGKTRSVDAPTVNVKLSTDAVAVMGVSWETFSDAAAGGLEIALTTELGHPSEHDSGYIDPLEEDLALCAGDQWAGEMRQQLQEACQTLENYPPHGAAAFFGVQRVVGDAMLAVVEDARERDDLSRRHTNTLWRLVRLSEALGRVADGIGARWPRMNNVDQDDIDRTVNLVNSTRSRVAKATGGAECPFADRLLDRTLEGVDRARRSGGHTRGAWWAATLTARAAHALTAIERPQMRKVFMVGNFSSADIIRKGILLRPGEQHKLQARVYNFLQEDVSGQLQTQLPEHWGTLIGDGQFAAPAGGVSEPVELAFTVPGGPGPWVQAEIPNKYRIKVDLPQTASVNTSLNLAGSTGRGPLEEMLYRVYVGVYPSKGGAVVDDQVEPRRRLYWLASGITGAPR